MFDFDIGSLKSEVDYDGDDWQTNVFLNTQISSLAFNTVHGSFAKQKELKGTFSVSYSVENEKIDVVTKNLKIGTDTFDITAFLTLPKAMRFSESISTPVFYGKMLRI